MEAASKNRARIRRHYRVRTKIKGTPARPRMSVYKSNRHLYVQFIDDSTSNTLASVSTMTKGFDGKGNGSEIARELGLAAGDAAKAKGIEEVVFDRGGFSYEGNLAALADAAREKGLKF